MRPATIKCAFFDLETTSLTADFGVVLCAAIKVNDGKTKVLRQDYINPDFERDRANDRDLVVAIWNELHQADWLIAHNGLGFDLPFLNTRLAHWGCTPLPPKRLIDPVRIARRKLLLSSNRLDSIAALTPRGPRKLPLDAHTWTQAALSGCPSAMNKLARRCARDVEVLAHVFEMIKPHVRELWDLGPPC
jgi:DNA polymerase III epsilon subunit-like protein